MSGMIAKLAGRRLWDGVVKGEAIPDVKIGKKHWAHWRTRLVAADGGQAAWTVGVSMAEIESVNKIHRRRN